MVPRLVPVAQQALLLMMLVLTLQELVRNVRRESFQQIMDKQNVTNAPRILINQMKENPLVSHAQLVKLLIQEKINANKRDLKKGK